MMFGDDYHKCDAQVENYKTCKRFWVNMKTIVNWLKDDSVFYQYGVIVNWDYAHPLKLEKSYWP